MFFEEEQFGRLCQKQRTLRHILQLHLILAAKKIFISDIYLNSSCSQMIFLQFIANFLREI